MAEKFIFYQIFFFAIGLIFFKTLILFSQFNSSVVVFELKNSVCVLCICKVWFFLHWMVCVICTLYVQCGTRLCTHFTLFFNILLNFLSLFLYIFWLYCTCLSFFAILLLLLWCSVYIVNIDSRCIYTFYSLSQTKIVLFWSVSWILSLKSIFWFLIENYFFYCYSDKLNSITMPNFSYSRTWTVTMLQYRSKLDCSAHLKIRLKCLSQGTIRLKTVPEEKRNEKKEINQSIKSIN